MLKNESTSNNLFASLPKELVVKLMSHLPKRDKASLVYGIASIWRNLATSNPRVLLQHPLETQEYLNAPTSVERIDLPFVPIHIAEEFEASYISQLHNGRFIYCYPDGDIHLLAPSEYLTLLPESQTIAVHELKDHRLIICMANNETRLVDLTKKTTLKMDLPGTMIKCVLSFDLQFVWIGMADGQLLQWDLANNAIQRKWYLTAPTDKTLTAENKDYRPETSDNSSNGLPIIGIARNIDEKLFLVLDIPNGYVTCLFNPADKTIVTLKRNICYDGVKFMHTSDRVMYNRFGDINIYLRDKFIPYMGRMITTDRLTYAHNLKTNITDKITISAFMAPNGNLLFSAYHNDDDESSPEANEEKSDNEKRFLEILKF